MESANIHTVITKMLFTLVGMLLSMKIDIHFLPSPATSYRRIIWKPSPMAEFDKVLDRSFANNDISS